MTSHVVVSHVTNHVTLHVSGHVACLSVQLEPPESILLHMKGASLHFLFDSAWTLSGSQQGKYLRILSLTMLCHSCLSL